MYRARPDGEGSFQAPEPLPEPINSEGRDDGAWVSPDGQTMLITYADRGGCGGGDLFIAYRRDGEWIEPVNLGCDINSPYGELAATLIPGTRTLVFPSTRPMPGAPPETIALWSVELPESIE